MGSVAVAPKHRKVEKHGPRNIPHAAHMVTPVVPTTCQGQELVPVSITVLTLVLSKLLLNK